MKAKNISPKQYAVIKITKMCEDRIALFKVFFERGLITQYDFIQEVSRCRMIKLNAIQELEKAK